MICPCLYSLCLGHIHMEQPCGPCSQAMAVGTVIERNHVLCLCLSPCSFLLVLGNFAKRLRYQDTQLGYENDDDSAKAALSVKTETVPFRHRSPTSLSPALFLLFMLFRISQISDHRYHTAHDSADRRKGLLMRCLCKRAAQAIQCRHSLQRSRARSYAVCQLRTEVN